MTTTTETAIATATATSKKDKEKRLCSHRAATCGTSTPFSPASFLSSSSIVTLFFVVCCFCCFGNQQYSCFQPCSSFYLVGTYQRRINNTNNNNSRDGDVSSYSMCGVSFLTTAMKSSTDDDNNNNDQNSKSMKEEEEEYAVLSANNNNNKNSNIQEESSSSNKNTKVSSLKQYIIDAEEKNTQNSNMNSNLRKVIIQVARSCAEISLRLRTPIPPPFISSSSSIRDNNNSDNATVVINVQGEIQHDIDRIANDIFQTNLKPVIAIMASEENDDVIYGDRYYCCDDNDNNNNNDNKDEQKFYYEIAFDPLDGSSNLDVNLPTGSIFGIWEYNYSNNNNNNDGQQQLPFTKPGSELLVAGYALYSSSTELVLAFNNRNHNHNKNSSSNGSKRQNKNNVVGFTLDPKYNTTATVDAAAEDSFVLTRPSIVCPNSGPYYSLNEARANDWSPALQNWITDAKLGQTTKAKTNYTSRYVCSLVADFHRTIIKGGWCGNPRNHLRLLYEAAPLAFVIDAAGGKGTTGELILEETSNNNTNSSNKNISNNLLDVALPTIDVDTAADDDVDGQQQNQQQRVLLHDRISVFLGSKNDIDDLLSYGDVRQIVQSYQS